MPDNTEGLLAHEEIVTITAESDALVVFGDGFVSVHPTLARMQQLTVGIALMILRLRRPMA